MAEEIIPDVRRLGSNVVKMVSSFAQESERAAVILGAATVDVELEKLLTAVLRPTSGKTDNLLDSDRPIGSFSAKISLLHRLYFIDDDTQVCLNLIRRIRNDFAHSIDDANLRQPPHSDRLRELVQIVKSRSPDYSHYHDGLMSFGWSGPLLEFTCCLASMVAAIELVIHEVKPLRPTHMVRISASED